MLLAKPILVLAVACMLLEAECLSSSAGVERKIFREPWKRIKKLTPGRALKHCRKALEQCRLARQLPPPKVEEPDLPPPPPEMKPVTARRSLKRKAPSLPSEPKPAEEATASQRKAPPPPVTIPAFQPPPPPPFQAEPLGQQGPPVVQPRLSLTRKAEKEQAPPFPITPGRQLPFGPKDLEEVIRTLKKPRTEQTTTQSLFNPFAAALHKRLDAQARATRGEPLKEPPRRKPPREVQSGIDT